VDGDGGGGDRHRRAVDDGLGGRVVGDPADSGDRPVPNPDVGREPGIAGAVDDAPVSDQDVEHPAGLRSLDGGQKPGFAARNVSISACAFLCSVAGSAPWNAAETAASTTSEIFW